MRSMKLLFGSQNSRSLNTANLCERRENWFLKTIRQPMVSSKCQNEAHTLPSVVVRTSFKIFRALLDVRLRMCRLSQALQIDGSRVKHVV